MTGLFFFYNIQWYKLMSAEYVLRTQMLRIQWLKGIHASSILGGEDDSDHVTANGVGNSTHVSRSPYIEILKWDLRDIWIRDNNLLLGYFTLMDFVRYRVDLTRN